MSEKISHVCCAAYADCESLQSCYYLLEDKLATFCSFHSQFLHKKEAKLANFMTTPTKKC